MHVEEDEQIGGAIALVLAVVALQLPRLGLNGLANLADELGRAFVETDHWALPIGFFSIEVEHIFHPGDKLAVDLRDAPHILAPGLELVFLQAPAHGFARDGVMLGEPDRLTISLVRSSSVQRAWPLGGLEQAVATSRASSLPDSLRSAQGRGSSLSAASRLPITKRRLVR
jgi:hypothetical protein